MRKSNNPPLPGSISNEANEQQLKVARRQGDAYKESLAAMDKETDGRTKSITEGDYIITYAEEEAEGMYVWNDEGKLVWQNPEKENAHIEIAVQDAHDGRFVPYLDVYVAIYKTGEDRAVIHEKLPFLWHSWLHHYGANIRIPEPGNYDINVEVGPLKVSRHDKKNGQRYTQPVRVRFNNVPLATGQELS